MGIVEWVRSFARVGALVRKQDWRSVSRLRMGTRWARGPSSGPHGPAALVWGGESSRSVGSWLLGTADAARLEDGGRGEMTKPGATSCGFGGEHLRHIQAVRESMAFLTDVSTGLG